MSSFQQAQRLGVPVSYSTMTNLSPYDMRQAQQYNQNVAAQQAAFTAQATGKK